MKTTKILTILVLALVLCQATVSEAVDMGTAFTYQGRLMDKNKPADGLYDFQFRLYDSNDPCTGTLLGSPIDINDLDVIDGHFVVELDFGSGIFDGNAVWLETRVVESPMGSDPATLSPLLELTPTPYALYAKNSGIQDAILRGFEVANTADDDTTVTVRPGAAYHGTTAVTKTANITLTFATAGDWYDGATHSYSGGAGWCHIGYDSSGNIKLLANNPPDVDDSSGNNASGATKYYFDDSKGTSGEYWRVIGAVYVDTDNRIHANYVTYQIGAWIYYDARQNIALSDTSWTDIDCSPIVPAISQLIMFQLDASSRQQVYFRPNGSSNDSGTLYFLNSSTAVHPAQILALDSNQLCEGKVKLGSGYATLGIVAYYMHIR